MLKNATMAEIIDAAVADVVVDVYCSSRYAQTLERIEISDLSIVYNDTE